MLHFLRLLSESVGDQERDVDESFGAVLDARLVPRAETRAQRGRLHARVPTHVVDLMGHGHQLH